MDDDSTADVNNMMENAGFIDWKVAGTRVDNSEASSISGASARRSIQDNSKAGGSRQSERKVNKSNLSYGRPAKKRQRDNDQDDNGLPGKNLGGQDKGRDDNADGTKVRDDDGGDKHTRKSGGGR